MSTFFTCAQEPLNQTYHNEGCPRYVSHGIFASAAAAAELPKSGTEAPIPTT
jgi:hypothetical protein